MIKKKKKLNSLSHITNPPPPPPVRSKDGSPLGAPSQFAIKVCKNLPNMKKEFTTHSEKYYKHTNDSTVLKSR